jgi:hypothetical protein
MESSVTTNYTAKDIYYRYTTGLFKTSTNIIIRCHPNDWRLKFINYLAVGKLVRHVPVQNSNGLDMTSVIYASERIRKGTTGIVVHQIQDESKSIDDTFMLIIWEALPFKPPLVYAGFVKADGDETKWNDEVLRNLYKMYYCATRDDKHVSDLWALNGRKIQLETILTDGNDHTLTVAIYNCRDEDILKRPRRINLDNYQHKV